MKNCFHEERERERGGVVFVREKEREGERERDMKSVFVTKREGEFHDEGN
jgi:hypothetical protein